MTDLELTFDYAHPPERVWQALTEAALLDEWFAPCDGPATFQAGEQVRFSLDDPVDGQVLEAEAPYRLAMHWQATQLHARVTWELIPTGHGCRVDVGMFGFLGLPTGFHRERWRTLLEARFDVGLRAVLDRLAVDSSEPVVARRPRVGSPPGGGQVPPRRLIPRQRSPVRVAPVAVAAVVAPAPRPRRPWLYLGLALGSAVVVVAMVTALVLSATRPEPVAGRVGPGELRVPTTATAPVEPPARQVIGSPVAPATPGSRGGGAPSPSTALTPSTPLTPSRAAPGRTEAAPARPVLTAEYTVERTGLLGATGYRVTARVTNPGPVAVGDWRLEFTLRNGQEALAVSGANHRQEGTTLTLTPVASTPPGGSATITYEVSGLLAGEPSGCRIDDRPCG